MKSTLVSSLRLAAALSIVASLSNAPLPAQVWEARNRLLASTAADGGQEFGEVLAVGDFDGDGTDDLAIGSPHATFEGASNAGRVEVRFGGKAAPLALGSSVLGLESPNLQAGSALAAGDFDGDGRDELAVGLPGADLGSNPVRDAVGWVIVYHAQPGAALSLLSAWHQDVSGVLGVAEAGDRFGETLAAGDFDADGYDDLAIAATFEDTPAGDSSDGAVAVLYGSPTGLTATGNQLWYRGDGGISGPQGADRELGSALAAGDFDGDGFADLAIGTPYGGSGSSDGSVDALFGSAAGLISQFQQYVDRETLGVDDAHAGGYFGIALAAGDFDRDPTCVQFDDCTDDLAIASTNAYVGEVQAGRVYVIHGELGIGFGDGTEATRLSQSIFDPVKGTPPETADGFGLALAAGRLGSDFTADLAIGSPEETLEGVAHGGCVHVARRLIEPFALDSNPSTEYFVAKAPLAAAPAATGDNFGAALAIGDFDHDGAGDLAIGVPDHAGKGAVQILFGALFADGFELGSTANWPGL